MSGKPIDDKKADVVSRMLVFEPGISETGNQTNLWSLFFHSRSDENQISQDLSSAALTKIERIHSLLLLLFFLWDRRGRGRFTLFLFLANHFGSSHSCGFSHNWFCFDCWGEYLECRAIG